MAPELFAGKAYKPQECDIFAMGNILFIMYAGYFAFNEASLKNPLYNFLLQGKPDIFWRYHEKKQSNNPDFFTKDFKILITKMINPDPSERADIDFIKKSDWYTKTPKATLEEAKELFEKRGLKI